MNAVEIDEAVSDLIAKPFDPATFAFEFLIAFGAKETTVNRLRKGDTNASDVPGGVLQRNNIHIAVAPADEVAGTLAALRASPKTAAQKAKFVLATDGRTVEAEDLASGEPLACAYGDLPRNFGFFLPLAGISTVKEIKNNPIDVKATGRLNRLYVELLKDNPDWATEARRHELNQFMARLIFCFFAEDTGIFHGEGLFSATVAQMSHAGHGSGEEQWGDTHEVLQQLFLAMDTPVQHDGNPDQRYRRAAGVRPWADIFPYVNGGMFTGAADCPRFSRTARAYLLRAGELDWREINPDIFGSMIQAVADEGERGELGMHYTSVPNILKVLNPLFLDDLREQLEAAGDSRPKLRNLRRRLSSIRVFDPACGSGNFLVIAYKEMRKVEAEIVERLGGEGALKLDERRSVIPLSNFYGIEIKDFAAEIARLGLLIAEFQADCLYLSQQEARSMVLPLHRTGQITVGNALRIDWLEVCPPAGKAMPVEHDLAGPTGRLALDESGLIYGDGTETYVCGNPPYAGSVKQNPEQKEDLAGLFQPGGTEWKSLDYVAGWLLKAAEYSRNADVSFSFVSTKSICQGEQVPLLWPILFEKHLTIKFAYEPFEWANLAAHNAGVTVTVIGMAHEASKKELFKADAAGNLTARSVANINPYLFPGDNLVVRPRSAPLDDRPAMIRGNMANDGGHLIIDGKELESVIGNNLRSRRFVKRFVGSSEFINSSYRHCLWIEDAELADALSNPRIAERVENVRRVRSTTGGTQAKANASTPHRFVFAPHRSGRAIVVPRVSSVNREYLPVGYVVGDIVVSDRAAVIYGGDTWLLAVLASRLHQCWIATVCVRMRMDYSYSNTLGWNTFPVPKLTTQNKADLTRTAENILLAREAHFPATIADLYDPDAMPDDLRRAHEENDEVLERIYIGRRFRNDTERLEKLFELYAKMTADGPSEGKSPKKGRKAA